MKIKNIFLLSLLLLAIISIGAVSAQENITQDSDNSLKEISTEDDMLELDESAAEAVAVDEASEDEVLSAGGYAYIVHDHVAKDRDVKLSVLIDEVAPTAYKIDGKSVTAKFYDNDDVTALYTISTKGFNLGKHTLSLKMGSESYTFPFWIENIAVEVPENINLNTYLNPIYVSLPEGCNDPVTVTIDGNSTTYNKDEFIVFLDNLTHLNDKNYIHKIIIDYPNGNYHKEFDLAPFYEIDPYIYLEQSVYNLGESGQFKFSNLRNASADKFTATLDGKECEVQYDGIYQYIISIPNTLSLGKHTLVLKYAGDENYYENTQTFNFAVVDTQIPQKVTNGKPTGSVNAPGCQGNVILSAYSNNENYRIPFKLVNGKATISFAKFNKGTYIVHLYYEFTDINSYGSGIYMITVDNTKITAKDFTKYYGSSTGFKVKVADYKGKIVKSKYVKFYINGKYVKKVKTNKKGIATLKINKAPGTYKITAKYGQVEITRNLKVKHSAALKTVKVKKSAKKLVLSATLKNGKKALKNKKVTFKFNGKTYKAKTNKKGVAKVTIKKSVLKKLKVGKTVKYQVKYLKDTVKKSAIVQK